MNTSMTHATEPALTIPVDTVCFIIGKLREYESSDLFIEGEDASPPPEIDDVDQLVEQENETGFDPIRQELESFIGDLPEDQKVDLVALMWLGRNNASAADWPSTREDAAQAYNTRTSSYVLGSPMASDFLEEGLSLLGYSCDDSSTKAL